MKRIAFLDYVRVFACLLVMVVHASENFYGAAGTGEMAGPQSFLQNEADRFWVSLYDGFSRMSVPLFMIISAYLLVPLKEGQSMWQFYRRRFLRVGPPTILFMLLYSTLPLLWGQIDSATATRDLSRLLLNFPSLAGHLWFMYPLISLYLFIPIYPPGCAKQQPKKKASSSPCSPCPPACPTCTAGSASCGENVSGTNTTCCGTSPDSSDTWSWRTTSAPT